MKKSLLTLIACSFAFGLGFGINNLAFSDGTNLKIAYVDTAKLVSASKNFKSAQDTRKKQTEEMLKWYDVTNKEIQSQKTTEAKQALIKKYEVQLTQKKKTINEAYGKKVKEVNTQIESVIAQKAKDMGYDIVLKGDVVLYGASDLTASVLPSVK